MRRAVGISILVLGLLLALTPWYIFPVCGQGRFAPLSGKKLKAHPCAGAARAETALAAAVALAGIAAAVRPRRRTTLIASIVAAGLAVPVALAPAVAGICKMATMPCRAGAVPAVVFLAVLLLATGIAGILLARANSKDGLLTLHRRPFGEAHFAAPRLQGIDFPRVTLRRAVYDQGRRALVFTTEPGGAKGGETKVKLNQLDQATSYRLYRDGGEIDSFQFVSEREVKVPLDGRHDFALVADRASL